MSDQLRVCVVSYKFAPAVGGAEKRAEKLARQLQATGHIALVITLRLQRSWPRNEQLSGLPVIRIGGLYWLHGRLLLGKWGRICSDLLLFCTLWRLRARYDLLHVCQASSQAAVAALIGRLTGKPVVVCLQSTGPDEDQLQRLAQGATLLADTLPSTVDFLSPGPLDWLVGSELTTLPHTAFGGRLLAWSLCQNSAVSFQALSQRSKAHLLAQGIPARRIHRISGSVDTKRFSPGTEEPDFLSPLIICVARLDYSKGIDVLLHAWARLQALLNGSGVRPRLALVGDGPLRPQMEQMIAALGIVESVKLLGARDDVTERLRSAWGFVLPSRWEGMPNALLEAMACGLPCVATRVSGSEECIISEQNGLLVASEQPIELAEALRRLLTDPELALRLGQQARQTVLQRYQLSQVTEQCVALYRDLLVEKRGRKAEKVQQEIGKLRIYIAISTFHPSVGGAEKQAWMQTQLLRQRGYRATVLTFRFQKDWPARDLVGDVPVIRVAGRLLSGHRRWPAPISKFLYLLALLEMGRAAWRHRHQYDVLHVYHLNLFMLPLALSCLFSRKKLIIGVRSAGEESSQPSTHFYTLMAGSLDPTTDWLRIPGRISLGGDLNDLERLGRIGVYLTLLLLRHLRAVIVVLSSRMKMYLLAHRFTLDDIVLIPNGVDIQRFSPVEGEKAAESALRVICVSRLCYRKGSDLLLHAWKIVVQEAPQARLILVGDGPVRAQLMHMAEALAIADSVEFVGVQEDIPVLLRQCAISVLPSRLEGMPNALLEAMACGLACVATRVSGSEDILTHEVNGLLVEPEDQYALAEALLILLRNPSLVWRYGAAARQHIKRCYTVEHITDTYLKLYQAVVDRKVRCVSALRGKVLEKDGVECAE